MDLDEILTKYPDMGKITEALINDVVVKITGESLDCNKTFADNGFDELDCVEMVMILEKELDISIPDEVFPLLFDCDCRPKLFRKYWREKKLNDLGI